MFYYLQSNLKYLQQKNNLSQRDIAKIFNVSISGVEKWTKTKYSIPSIEKLDEIRNYYKLTFDELILKDLSINDEDENQQTSFKINLKKRRKEKNLTQEELALKLNVSKTTIANYEQGLKEPSIDKLKKLTEILNCSFNDLLE